MKLYEHNLYLLVLDQFVKRTPLILVWTFSWEKKGWVEFWDIWLHFWKMGWRFRVIMFTDAASNLSLSYSKISLFIKLEKNCIMQTLCRNLLRVLSHRTWASCSTHLMFLNHFTECFGIYTSLKKLIWAEEEWIVIKAINKSGVVLEAS
jgi:hypothetical protein